MSPRKWAWMYGGAGVRERVAAALFDEYLSGAMGWDEYFNEMEALDGYLCGE